MGTTVCVPGTPFAPSMINMSDIILWRWCLFSCNFSFHLFFKRSAQRRAKLYASFRLWFTWSGFELKHWKWSHTYTTPTGVCGWLGKPNHILSHISTSTKIMNYSLSTKTNVLKKYRVSGVNDTQNRKVIKVHSLFFVCLFFTFLFACPYIWAVSSKLWFKYIKWRNSTDILGKIVSPLIQICLKYLNLEGQFELLLVF